MADEKRYFWLRLYDDFFTSKRIKKLRALAGGDTYTIIYLKMQLKALKTEGYLYFDNVMNDFAEEIALDIDENPDDVRVTVQYLLSVGLLECSEDGEKYFLTYLPNLIGSETASTQRSRDYRKKKKEQEVLQCNKNATDLQQNATEMQRTCNVEKEIEKEKDKDIDNTPLTPQGKEWDAEKHTNVQNFDHLVQTEMNEVSNTNLLECVRIWLQYKDGRKPRATHHYQLQSIRGLTNKVFEQAKIYGPDAVIGIVNDSIANNYSGITWNELERRRPKRETTGSQSSIDEWIARKEREQNDNQ